MKFFNNSVDSMVKNPDLNRLEAYDYLLPEDRIAQYPVTPRDHSRLLFVSRKPQTFSDFHFYDLPRLLHPGDLLVINETRVLPVRLQSDIGEVLLVKAIDRQSWDALVYPGKHFKIGNEARFERNVRAKVISKSSIGRILCFEGNVEELIQRHGKMPLPPYIHRDADESDVQNYQTVYAKENGSIAAPTAGLHFSESVFKDLERRGVTIARLTLHVGPGTFRPVKTEDVTRHKIYPEFYFCDQKTWGLITRADRVVAVGTTTTRAIESIAATGKMSGYTDLFIYPGYRLLITGGLITNFHLPKSSLLMLVSAFGGYETIRAAYEHAVRSSYRFYSYGDAMLIL